MKKKKILTRISTFILAANLILATSSDAFAATASDEPAADELQLTNNIFSDEEMSRNRTDTTKENESTPETEQSGKSDTTPEAEQSDEAEENPESPANTEAVPTISEETDEKPENSDGAQRIRNNFDRADTNPESTPGSATEGEPETTSGIQIKDDNFIYCMDDTLYNGYYMDSAGILYLVFNGVAEPVSGIVNGETPYYKLPSNESLTLQTQTVFVNGKIYSGYFMDSTGIMYRVSNGTAALVTGALKENTSYFSLSAKGNVAISQQTLYVEGNVYSGYYLSGKNKMYEVKEGSLTLLTGTLKAKTKYYDYTKAKEQTLSKLKLYVNGKLFTGYYLNNKNKMYRAKKGSLTLLTGTLKAKTKYYDYTKAKKQTLSKLKLYVNGKPFTGYYLGNKDKMYRAKKGSLTPLTGTLKAKTKYYSYKKAKTLRLSKQKLYVKGKLYTGYYMNNKNKMYYSKKGSLTPLSGMLGAGTKYYSYKAGKTQTLSTETLYVGGIFYTGYYMGQDNRMYRAENGTCTLFTGTLGAGTTYYSHNDKKMQTLPAQTVYVNGKAMEGMSPESLATLQRAQAVVASITNDSMSMETKLQVCFDFVKTYQESRPRMPHYTGMDWPVIYANDMFVNGSGNCCSYAAAFAYMAKAIGYEEVYCCNSGGHGWAEINGLVYDPEWSKWHHTYNYYALSYDTKTDQDYKGAIGAGKPWMRIKI